MNGRVLTPREVAEIARRVQESPSYNQNMVVVNLLVTLAASEGELQAAATRVGALVAEVRELQAIIQRIREKQAEWNPAAYSR